MATLFCDVDGTLAFGDKTNWPLVDAIRKFLDEHAHFDLVVWSHAGIKHAREWAARCFTVEGYKTDVIAKDFTEVDPETDLVVDNMNLPFGIKPGQFVREVREDKLQLPEPDDGAPAGLAPYRDYDMSYWNSRMGASGR